MTESLTRTPERMTLVNLSSLAELHAQFNPTEFSEKVGSVFAKQTVHGMSHEVMQFSHSKNDVFNFTLFFSSANGGPSKQADNEKARLFLRSVCKPRGRDVGSVATGGTPRVLFIWPALLSLACFVTDVSFGYKRFNFAGSPVYFTAECTLERVLDAFLGSEDVYDGRE